VTSPWIPQVFIADTYANADPQSNDLGVPSLSIIPLASRAMAAGYGAQLSHSQAVVDASGNLHLAGAALFATRWRHSTEIIIRVDA
jgi:hypothetical protein